MTRRNQPETMRGLIERARESGYRDIADTMDMLLHEDDIFEVPGSEQPVSGMEAVNFRTGVILGVELENRGTDDEKPKHREALIQSLRNNGKRRLADAFEYCWSNPEGVTSDDFDSSELPLEGDSLFAFSIGISFGLAHTRARKA